MRLLSNDKWLIYQIFDEFWGDFDGLPLPTYETTPLYFDYNPCFWGIFNAPNNTLCIGSRVYRSAQ